MGGRRFTLVAIAMWLAASAVLAGCRARIYDPAKATRSYPAALHTTETVDIQVFRTGTHLEIVNSTARSYEDFDLWINQRFMRRVEALPAGKTVRIPLREFHDDYGEAFRAGGLFRTRAPMPVRLVEIQLDDETPLIGLLAVRAEEVD